MTDPLLTGLTPAAYFVTVALISHPSTVLSLLSRFLEFLNSISPDCLEVISAMLFSNGLMARGPIESLAVIYLSTLDLGKTALRLLFVALFAVWRLLRYFFASLNAKLAARKRMQNPYSAVCQPVSEPYQYSPLMGKECIRLLVLWPRGTSEAIFCELFSIPLDRAPPLPPSCYEAISYKLSDHAEGI
jgi:hypothetical protein